MKIRFYILTALFFSLYFIPRIEAAPCISVPTDSIPDAYISAFQDSALINAAHNKISYKFELITPERTLVSKDILRHKLDSLIKLPIKYSDSLLYQSDYLSLPLVYLDKKVKDIEKPDMDKIYLQPEKKDIPSWSKTDNDILSTESFVLSLRENARNEITNKRADLYCTIIDRLPSSNSFMQQRINYKPIRELSITQELPKPENGKIKIKDVGRMYWQKKASALFQFSQNYISSNWYQGGNSNLALLSILNGQLTYDNLKNIQWENKVEWRAGFNSVEGDTLRKIATNDDILRYTTKFGVKAFGNWYYSISGEASTQLFDNYKAINSTVLKARLLTPVRVNLGLGMDYKYKKLLSLMLAPFSFKYIYANDTTNVNPNLFGIEKGKNHLREIGSSLQAQLSYSPMMNWQITSRLTFFTNYKKVETDCEIVNLFNINRFISTRLSFNPRYDNTIILKNGEKSKIQFKQLLSIGLSLRLI
ncbi:MAG: DUF3078 domain-containing protein [Paludibacteraceae bacterium]